MFRLSTLLLFLWAWAACVPGAAPSTDSADAFGKADGFVDAWGMRVSAEEPVAGFAASAAAGLEPVLASASSHDSALLLYRPSSGSLDGIKYTRIDPAGVALDAPAPWLTETGRMPAASPLPGLPGYLVVWTEPLRGDGARVVAQRLGTDGVAWDETPVDLGAADRAARPSVACTEDAGCIVAWAGHRPAGLFGARLSLGGPELTPAVEMLSLDEAPAFDVAALASSGSLLVGYSTADGVFMIETRPAEESGLTGRQRVLEADLLAGAHTLWAATGAGPVVGWVRDGTLRLRRPWSEAEAPSGTDAGLSVPAGVKVRSLVARRAEPGFLVVLDAEDPAGSASGLVPLTPEGSVVGESAPLPDPGAHAATLVELGEAVLAAWAAPVLGSTRIRGAMFDPRTLERAEGASVGYSTDVGNLQLHAVVRGPSAGAARLLIGDEGADHLSRPSPQVLRLIELPATAEAEPVPVVAGARLFSAAAATDGERVSVAWAERVGDRGWSLRLRQGEAPWLEVGTTAARVAHVSVAAHDGGALVAWRSGPGRHGTVRVRRVSAAAELATPVSLSGPDAGDPTVVRLHGSYLAVWSEGDRMWAAEGSPDGAFGDPLELGETTAVAPATVAVNDGRALVAWDAAAGGRTVRWSVVAEGRGLGSGEHALPAAAADFAVAPFGDGFILAWPETPRTGRPRALHGLRIDSAAQVVDGAAVALVELDESTRRVRFAGLDSGRLVLAYERQELGRRRVFFRELSVAHQALGESCDRGAQCGSGHCVDGVCCDGVCAGDCMVCGVDRGAEQDGQCTPVSELACGSAGFCDEGVCLEPEPSEDGGAPDGNTEPPDAGSSPPDAAGKQDPSPTVDGGVGGPGGDPGDETPTAPPTAGGSCSAQPSGAIPVPVIFLLGVVALWGRRSRLAR